MNFEHILAEIEKVDPEVYDRLDTRRHAMQRFRSASGKIALAAIPTAIGAMFSKAYGQTAALAPKAILQYALTLEYLEAAFYTEGVSKATTIGIPTGAPLTALTKIRDDENKHVAFLVEAIKGITGSMPADYASPRIDLTGGGGSTTVPGPFAGAYGANGYPVFLALAQTFEDTGVRAYKGQAGSLVKNPYLESALKIHSVEARHAAHIRYMRSVLGGATVPANTIVKPWITQAQSGITTGNAGVDSVIQQSYSGTISENLSTQSGVPITSIMGVGGNLSLSAATEAFDEPLTYDEVIKIVKTDGKFIY